VGAPKLNHLSGAQKAAILLLALGEEVAGTLFSHLSPQEARRIASAISQTGRIDQSLVDEVVSEFQGKLKAVTGDRVIAGGPKAAIALLRQAKGIDTEKIVQEMGLDAPSKIEALERIDAKNLARILQRESPQTIAVVLAHLDAKKFGATLKLLPTSLHADCIIRVAKLEQVDPEMIAELDKMFNEELAKQQALSPGGKKLGGPAAVAAMLSSLWRETPFRTRDVSRVKRGISTYQALNAEIPPRPARQDTSLGR
jgi:flagellar motor switch protein FliG